jgi:hypothetical protein
VTSGQDVANEPGDEVDTLRVVYTSRQSLVYHVDPTCQAPTTAARSTSRSPRMAVEAIIAARYGRRACGACASEFGSALTELLPQVSSPERFDPQAIPLREIDTEDAQEDAQEDAREDAQEDDSGRVPYGSPEDPDDIRFNVSSAVGWGTASFGHNPTESLGEPTEDDHDWIRGPNRFLD